MELKYLLTLSLVSIIIKAYPEGEKLAKVEVPASESEESVSHFTHIL